MINDGVNRRTHKRAVDVAHEKVAAEQGTDLCLPEQVVLAC
jgi:hypothetical protein